MKLRALHIPALILLAAAAAHAQTPEPHGGPARAGDDASYNERGMAYHRAGEVRRGGRDDYSGGEGTLRND